MEYDLSALQHYENRSGQSGVHAFEIGETFVRVMFTDGGVYLYDHSKPGQKIVEHLKELANAGEGLNSYLSREVKQNYAAKER